MIFSNYSKIDRSNVLQCLSDALTVHSLNRTEIDYLYRYLKGEQPVRSRVKRINSEICNCIVVNRANEIVTFKTANFIGEPLQYVARGGNTDSPDRIGTLNALMLSENKASKDLRLAYWMFTAGVGYRLTLRDKAEKWMSGELFDEAPFEIYTLDPRNTFLVRSSDVSQKTLMGVTVVYPEPGRALYTVYTPDSVFYIEGSPERGSVITEERPCPLGMVPIVEYPCNEQRLGAFEIVIDLLDAINTIESNRVDAVEQFIQAIMVFEGVDVSREQLLELKDLGAIKLPPSLDGQSSRVYYLNEQLDQAQTQTLAEWLYQQVLQIVGVPAQGNANQSDNSNNGAVLIKNGWWNAEARAKETVAMWKQSETDFLKIILKICRDTGALSLKVSEIEQKFGRSSYEDKLTKVQAFVSLISAGAPPSQAFSISGLAVDPESAAVAFEKYGKYGKKDSLMNNLQ